MCTTSMNSFTFNMMTVIGSSSKSLQSAMTFDEAWTNGWFWPNSDHLRVEICVALEPLKESLECVPKYSE